MKPKNFIVPLFCIVLLSCEGEIIDTLKGSKSVNINAEIEGMRTRLTGTSWEEGDAIGVYMKKEGALLGTSTLAENVRYVYNDSTHNFMPAKPSDSLYFPFNGSNVDFIGYYPHREDITGLSYPVDLTLQSNQAAIDLMYCDNATGKNMSNPNVNLLFSHKLSKLVLQINHYRAINLSVLSVILTQVPTVTTFNLKDGTLSSSSQTMDIALGVNKTGTQAEAILLPGTDLSGSHLWFILGDDQTYHIPLASVISSPLAQSTRYQYNVTLYTDEEPLITTGGITEWITGPSEAITVDRTEDSPPAIKGSKTDPYTVSQAILNQGKTGVWVKGYIVGAFNGSISKFVTDSTGQVKTNVALADLATETEVSHMIPVNMTLSSLKNALNIADNPDNIGRSVMIKGDLAAYYSVPGLKETKEYQFMD